MFMSSARPTTLGNVVGDVVFGIVILLLVGYPVKQIMRFYWHRDRPRLRAASVGSVYTSDPGAILGWDDIQVTHIARTIFILWNPGSRPVTANDLSEENPIAVTINGHILDIRFLEPSARSVWVEYVKGKNYVIVQPQILGGEAFNHDRALCLEVVHDSADWKLGIAGQLGGMSIDWPYRKGPVTLKRRSWWAPILAGLGLLGLIASESIRDNPVWFDQNFIFHRNLIWILLFFAALGAIVVFLGSYYTQVITYGRSFKKNADKRLVRPGESPGDYNGARLWHQLVPWYLRRRDEVNEESFWEAYADRWSRKPALATSQTINEDGVRTTGPSGSVSRTGESVPKQFTKGKTEPAPAPVKPQMRLVRQQGQRQSRSKRSGKR